MARALLAAALLAPASGAAAELPLRVVTSIPPLAMLAAELGGDRVTAHSLLPPGADPHTFEPRPSDAKAVADAGIVVVLGSSIDDWLGGAIAPPADAVMVRLDEQHAGDDGHDHAGHSHDGGDDDPHVWLDPLWVRDRVVPALQRALMEADPKGGARYGASARAMSERLTDLDEDIREAFLRATTRSFLSWHPAWQRFARRYDLHSASSVGESGGREPSLKAMIGAVRAGRAAGVRAVLVEPQTDARQASVLADELGVALITVDPLGDAWSLERSTYGNLMRFNAAAFARALGVVKDEDEEEEAPVSALPVSPASP